MTSDEGTTTTVGEVTAELDSIEVAGTGRTIEELIADAKRQSLGDPVGPLEIAERLNVKPRTIHMWVHRDLLPEPDYDMVNGSKAWEWVRVLHWAGATGRLRPGSTVEREYRARFQSAPAKYHPRGRRAKVVTA